MSTTGATIDPEQQMLGEVEMVGRDRWEKIHRRAGAGGSIRVIACELDLDRKTVRRRLRQTEWKPYRRAARADTLPASHAEYLRRRTAAVGYSAQVLFHEPPAAGVPRQLGDGEAVRAAVLRFAPALSGVPLRPAVAAGTVRSVRPSGAAL